MLNKLLRLIRISVYVVVAYDAYRQKNKEVKVFFSLEKAQAEYRHLQGIFGAANVGYYSRFIV